MESPQLRVFMGKMPLQRSWFQSLVFIPFPWSRLRSALAGLGHTYFLVGLIVCAAIVYPIESATGTPTADDILKALPISAAQKAAGAEWQSGTVDDPGIKQPGNRRRDRHAYESQPRESRPVVPRR